MTRNVAVATASLLLVLYFIYFYIAGSEIDAGALGTLGDFIGGNINPLLTFVSTLLLIETLSLQRKATSAAEISAEEAQRTVKEQAALIKSQIFESSLFNLLNLCLDECKSCRVEIGGEALKGTQALGALEKLFNLRRQAGESPDMVIADLEDEHGDVLYGVIKSFSTIYAFVNANALPESTEHYISLVTKLIPVPVMYVICIARLHTDWKILASFEESGFFKKKGVIDLLAGYS